MIDANKIGIQLALPNGVSAGLRVIAQELGALDRAVAMAERLEALTAMAQGAARLVAAAEAIWAPIVAEPVAAVTEPTASGAPMATRASMAAQATMALGIAVATREVDFERLEVPPVAVRPAQATPVATIAGPIGATPGVVVPRGAASVTMPVAPPIAKAVATAAGMPAVSGQAAAPVQAAAPARAAPIMPQAVADGVPAAPGRAPATGPARLAASAIPVAPTTPAAVEAMRVAAPMARAAPVMETLLMETARAAPAGPAAPGAPIGAMEPVRAVERGIRQAPAAPLPRVPAVPAVPQTPAAPIAGRPGGQTAMPGRELLPGRPAAPPSQEQDGGKNGGDVMLDGRLVGHWLADRMGRDAARPPVGTTHFNPRQAAAWTLGGGS